MIYVYEDTCFIKQGGNFVLTQKIAGNDLQKMIDFGAINIANHSNEIDAMNVFPVPDGDTGTNMNLSMRSGAEAVAKLNSEHVGEMMKAFARGLLMGARGNSGVILSQIFRGFSTYLERAETVDPTQFANAMQSGVKTAYSAVQEPVEGTILTVARETADKAVKLAETATDFKVFLKAVVEVANESLLNTPELLPILKEVGVVDSGGKGLVVIYEGFSKALHDEELSRHSDESSDYVIHTPQTPQGCIQGEDIKYGYCTEFMVELTDKMNFDEDVFREKLTKSGDSLVVVRDEELVKVHVHTEQPGDAMTYAQGYGQLINIKIENMRQQHEAIIQEKENVNLLQDYAIIAVSDGSGNNQIFTDSGVSYILPGGQTMNPSIESVADAIKSVNAKRVFILPNNKNIILAAEQAANMSPTNTEVRVIPSRSILEGMSAILTFNDAADLETNVQIMNDAMADVTTGQVTYAVRDTKIGDIKVKKNDYIGLENNNIICSERTKRATLDDLLKHLVNDDTEILTILCGKDILENEIRELTDDLTAKYPDFDLFIHDGGQEVYSYLVSVE